MYMEINSVNNGSIRKFLIAAYLGIGVQVYSEVQFVECQFNFSQYETSSAGKNV